MSGLGPVRLGQGSISFGSWTPDPGITLPEQLVGKMEIDHKTFLGIKFETNHLLQFSFISLDRMNNFVSFLYNFRFEKCFLRST